MPDENSQPLVAPTLPDDTQANAAPTATADASQAPLVADLAPQESAPDAPVPTSEPAPVVDVATLQAENAQLRDQVSKLTDELGMLVNGAKEDSKAERLKRALLEFLA